MSETVKQIAQEGARRQITVMFVDIVDSSALAAHTDAEDLSDWLEAYYRRTAQIVEAHGGEVTEYLGDGVVACFGLRVADELSATRAVSAARAAVSPLDPPRGWDQQIALRCGVATGEVATRDAGGQMPKATGAVTTLACRIQEQAAPGEVMIAAATRELMRGSFDSQKLADQKLKGFAEVQSLYRVGATPRAPATALPEGATFKAKFVGRARERAMITAASQPCLIVGQAGIGKTAFTAAVTADRQDTAWLWADGLHATASYYPFRFWLENRLGSAAEGTDALATAFPELSPIARQALALVLGRPEGLRLLTEKSNLAVKALIEQSLCGALSGSATIVIEDLHWLDSASLGVLAVLLEHPAATQSKIIMTSRETTKIGDFLDQSRLEIISLGPLDSSEARDMVTALAAGQTGGADHDWLVDKAEGVPLFLEQLYKRGNRNKQAVPPTLMDLLAQRIDETGPAKHALQHAAILGRQFAKDVLAALVPEGETLDKHLAIAVGQGVLEKASPNEWRFSHALLHQAAYHGMLRKHREPLHARAAEVLKSDFPQIATAYPSLVAYHHEQARNFAPAILAYLDASQLALYQGAMADAESHTRAAIDLCQAAPPEMETTDLEIAAYTALGSVLMQLQGFAAAPVRDAFETVHSLAVAAGRPSQATAPALFGSFSHAIIAGDAARAETFCDLLEAVSRKPTNESDQSEVQLATLTAKNCLCFYSGDFSAQFAHIREIRGLYQLAQHGGMIQRYGMDVFAAAQMFEPAARAITGQTGTVTDLIAETDRHQSLLNIPVMQPYALIWGAVPLFYAGQTDTALARLERGIAAADEQGAMFWQVLGRVWQVIMDDSLRATEAGREALRNGIATLAAIGSGIGQSYFEAHLARTISEAGDVNEACRMSGAAVTACADSRLLCWYPEILRLHALNCAAAGREDEAATARTTGLQAARAQGAALWELRLLLDLPASDRQRQAGLAALVSRLDQAGDLPERAAAKAALAGADI